MVSGHRLVVGLTLLAILLVAPRVDAFHPYFSFAGPVNPEKGKSAGGNGVYFTGSPRWGGLDCAACHIDGAGLIRMKLSSDPPSLFETLEYEPGADYLITAVMEGEHRIATDQPFNENSFLMEFSDDAGVPMVDYAPLTDACTAEKDGAKRDCIVPGYEVTSVLGVAPNVGTSWQFYVEMPGPGSGALTLYLSAVDGDSAFTVPGDEPLTDPFGDDTWTGKWRICEAGDPCQASVPAGDVGPDFISPGTAGGCSFSGSQGRGGALFSFAMLGLFALRRRASWGVIALVAAAGCFDPELPSECPARICTGGDGGSSLVAEGSGGDPSASTAETTSTTTTTAATTSGGGEFKPEPCDCAECMTHADCQQRCERPEGINACFFPNEGCWLTTKDCPK